MVDVTAFGGIVDALKGALDITKSIKDLSGGAALKAQAVELQTQIVTAQLSAIQANEERSALVEQVRELEKEVADLKAWGNEKEQYELKHVDSGALVYVPKPNTDAAKEPHWLCANCYEDGKKSYVQSQGRTTDRGLMVYLCTRCKGGFKTGWHIDPKHMGN